MPAVPKHKTATVDSPWDGPANKTRVRAGENQGYYEKIYAWRETGADLTLKGSWKFIHHEVAANGDPGAANTVGCSAGIAVLNGGRGGTTIPAADRQGVYDHLAKHIQDAGKEAPPLQDLAPSYAIKAQNQSAEIWIYEEIGDYWGGGVSAKALAQDLKAMGPVQNILLHLNSPGGIVWDGIAIYNLLKQHQARVQVNIDGLAASIASVVAMAGDEINMADNAMMMIHDPWALTIGTAADMRAAAEQLDKIRDSILLAYLNQQKKTGPGQEERLSGMMAAETWFSAAEALDQGLITQVTGSLALAAHFDLSKFKYHKVPEIFSRTTKDNELKRQFESLSLRITERYEDRKIK